MTSPTTARDLLTHFLQGMDPPATKQRAKTLPFRSLTSLSLQAILEAGAGRRGAWDGASGRKSPREEEGRSTGEGERNRDETSWPRI